MLGLIPNTKSGFGIIFWHWINFSAGTEFVSLPRLMTKIWPLTLHFKVYFHDFSDDLQTLFFICAFFAKISKSPGTRVSLNGGAEYELSL